MKKGNSIMKEPIYKVYTVIDTTTGQEANIKDFAPSWWHSKRNLKWILKQDGTLQIENGYAIEFVNADKLNIVFNGNENNEVNPVKNEILILLQKILDLVKHL